MSEPNERTVEVNGEPCRVWEKGEGEKLGFLAGIGGLPRWTPFLDRLAERCHVIAPSLPGFPGALGHTELDSQLDWVLATHDALQGAGLDGADLIGVSVGGALAADVAAIWPGMVRRLVLIAPLGLFDESEPVADIWAQRPGGIPELVCADPRNFTTLTAVPDGADELEWQILQLRAQEAAARLLWPLSDTHLRKRLHRITQPTLLLWGGADRVVPVSYAERFATEIAGPTEIQVIPDAGHLAELDAPEATSAAVSAFLG